MRIYGHREHRFDNRATHGEIRIPRNASVEVDDAIGAMLVAAHPDKLCDVTAEADPSAHVCPKTETANQYYEHRMMEQPPQTTDMVPVKYSRQKRKLLKAAQHRSVIARRASKP